MEIDSLSFSLNGAIIHAKPRNETLNTYYTTLRTIDLYYLMV